MVKSYTKELTFQQYEEIFHAVSGVDAPIMHFCSLLGYACSLDDF